MVKRHSMSDKQIKEPARGMRRFKTEINFTERKKMQAPPSPMTSMSMKEGLVKVSRHCLRMAQYNTKLDAEYGRTQFFEEIVRTPEKPRPRHVDVSADVTGYTQPAEPMRTAGQKVYSTKTSEPVFSKKQSGTLETVKLKSPAKSPIAQTATSNDALEARSLGALQNISHEICSLAVTDAQMAIENVQSKDIVLPEQNETQQKRSVPFATETTTKHADVSTPFVVSEVKYTDDTQQESKVDISDTTTMDVAEPLKPLRKRTFSEEIVPIESVSKARRMNASRPQSSPTKGMRSTLETSSTSALPPLPYQKRKSKRSRSASTRRGSVCGPHMMQRPHTAGNRTATLPLQSGTVEFDPMSRWDTSTRRRPYSADYYTSTPSKNLNVGKDDAKAISREHTRREYYRPSNRGGSDLFISAARTDDAPPRLNKGSAQRRRNAAKKKGRTRLAPLMGDAPTLDASSSLLSL